MIIAKISKYLMHRGPRHRFYGEKYQILILLSNCHETEKKDKVISMKEIHAYYI